MFSDFEKVHAQDHGQHFWLLPQWRGALLADTDWDQRAWLNTDQTEGDRPRILSLHQGPVEADACRIIASGNYNFVFANGYTLKKRFLDCALQNDYTISAFWLEASLEIRKARSEGRPFPARFRASAHEQEHLARQLEARVIDASQPLPLVVADIWEQLLWEWAPPHLKAGHEPPESLIIPAADRS